MEFGARAHPLTEEWLLKFGFKKPAHTWCGDRFHLSSYDKEFGDPSVYVVALNKNNGILAEIKYVHQLQNLYFALTQTELVLREELTIKEDESS